MPLLRRLTRWMKNPVPDETGRKEVDVFIDSIPACLRGSWLSTIILAFGRAANRDVFHINGIEHFQ